MKTLLVLDKLSYKSNEILYKKMLEQKLGEGQIVYTTYEDRLIRKVRNIRVIGSLLQHILYWWKSFRYARKILKEKDVNRVICINPIVGIFLGIFNRRMNIVLAGFLFEPKKNKLYYNLRKFITHISLKGIDKVVVYSKQEVDYYQKILGLHKFVFVQYGINYMLKESYGGQDLPKEYLFSGGGSNRDYGTLINAYNVTKCQYPLLIATQPWRLDKYDTNKIVNLTDVVVENFGDVMQRSSLLILSLKDSSISAGHMVMLQAMDLGIPILVNDILAVRDYVNEQQVEFYESGNTEQLRQKIENYANNKLEYKEKARKAKELYNKEYTFDALLNRLFALYNC